MKNVLAHLECILATEADTRALGTTLASLGAAPRGVVCLHGDLGAGKTTLVRAWLRGLGHEGAVRSPTYTLVEPYEVKIGRACFELMHFDLYRMADEEELDAIGFRDYLAGDALCVIEWPERAPGLLADADLDISLVVEGESRRARFEARTARASQWLHRAFPGRVASDALR